MCYGRFSSRLMPSRSRTALTSRTTARQVRQPVLVLVIVLVIEFRGFDYEHEHEHVDEHEGHHQYDPHGPITSRFVPPRRIFDIRHSRFVICGLAAALPACDT